jgi:hypothetical protein
MKLHITKDEAIEFINCWRETIAKSSFVEPYNSYRAALVFSFDGELKAFLNYTKGYHRLRETRPYFARLPGLMNKIRDLMIPYRDLGGRVFIDDNEVYFVDISLPPQHLCEVKWPKDVDVVAEIKRLRPKPKSVMTLQIMTPRKKLAAKR